MARCVGSCGAAICPELDDRDGSVATEPFRDSVACSMESLTFVGLSLYLGRRQSGLPVLRGL
jgi:hypothetical protein